MNAENRIMEQIKQNNGTITTKEVINMKIARVNLSRLVKKGLIERKNHGLYILPTTWGDEYFNLIYNIPQAVFSHLTALYFHNLCERVPLFYDITVSKQYRGRLEKKEDIQLYKVDLEILNLGRITIKSPQGREISCYDVERCLCDLIKDRDNIDFEYLKKAFTQYYRIERNDTFKLYKYAKKLGIEKEINEFMEALL